MTSLSFPKMFVGNQVNVVYDSNATMQNLLLFIDSKKDEFFGDPSYSSGIEQNLFKFNNVILKDILKDQIYTTICNHFPQLVIAYSDITVELVSKTTLRVNINLYNDITKQNDIFNMNLMING